jgi:hypothetical protein
MRKLGATQEAVLDALRRHRSWNVRCPSWTWGSYSATLRLMERLATLGLRSARGRRLRQLLLPDAPALGDGALVIGFVPAEVRVTRYPYMDRNTCEAVEFGQADVKAFGLLCAYGDNVNRYMVELRDGRQLLLRGVGPAEGGPEVATEAREERGRSRRQPRSRVDLLLGRGAPALGDGALVKAGDRVVLRPYCERPGMVDRVDGDRADVSWDDGLGPNRCRVASLAPEGSPPDAEERWVVAAPKRGGRS